MTSPKAIRNQIITLLKSADPKNGAGKPVKKWFEAEPQRSTWLDFPFGWVECALGSVDPPVGSKAQIHDSFYVVIVDKHVEAKVAEDSILDFAETIKTALKGFPTIGDLVEGSWVSNCEKDKWFEQGSDYSFRAIRVTLTTRRRE